MLNVFRLVYIRQLYFITKMPTFGLYEYKVEGSGCGFNRKRGLAETDSYFVITFDMFWWSQKLTPQPVGHFSFLHSYDKKKSTKTEYYVCHKMSCIVHHTLVRWCTNAAFERRKCRDWCAVHDKWVTDVSIKLYTKSFHHHKHISVFF